MPAQNGNSPDLSKKKKKSETLRKQVHQKLTNNEK
jgi:hypothetical protein